MVAQFEIIFRLLSINCTKSAILVSGLTAVSFLPELGEKSVSCPLQRGVLLVES